MADDRSLDAQSDPTASPSEARSGVSRRSFLQWSALAGAGASLGGSLAARPAAARRLAPRHGPFPELEEATIAKLQAAMAAGTLTSVELVRRYAARIRDLDHGEGGLNSIIETNRDAERVAALRDVERAAGTVRGPLHGIPVVLKDNIDTGDRMMTTAGSLALVGDPASRDARAIWKLRRAGAVILGKATLSEWANFRGFSSSSGWSGRGGQCNNPYALDRNPCGSSSGSAAAVSANLAAGGLGSETDGSVVCPSSACGIVGIKPTVGLVSRTGVVPISHTQDTIGVHGRTVADAAALLGPLAGGDPLDPATFASAGRSFADYTPFVDPNGLAGKRIGVVRAASGASEETDAIFEQALAAMAAAGATLVDPADPPTPDIAFFDELVVLVWEFKRDLNAYLANRTGVPVATMADVIAFNEVHAAQELPYFGQQWFELSQAEIFTAAEYRESVERGPRLAGPEGIDAVLADAGLDALVAPTNSPAWPSDLINGDCFAFGTSGWAAVAGYPLVTVPAGEAFGLPVGVTFMGSAWSEPSLIEIAAGFEAVTGARRTPELFPTLPLDNGAGGPEIRGGPESEIDRRRSPGGRLAELEAQIRDRVETRVRARGLLPRLL